MIRRSRESLVRHDRHGSRLPRDSNLVVIYLGQDSRHHDRDAADPRRPRCQPIREPGLLKGRQDAEARGLIPCPDCWGVAEPGLANLEFP